MATDEKEKLTPAEEAKITGRYLRGDIGPELVDGNDFFGKTSELLLKAHGTYQQDDRDARAAARASGGGKGEKAFIFMVRTRVPGGKLTWQQMLAELDICDELGNSTLRITTRQGLQHHGIPKRSLKETIKRINDTKLTTLAACGDVNRNVMCCPAPHHFDPVHEQLQALTDALAEHFKPKTKAYYEIWLRDTCTGEQTCLQGDQDTASTAGDDVEPIYGPTYLPRKFKMAVGLPGDNCVDLYANDLGFMAICENFNVVGYNLVVGGGFGVTPSAKKTFPAVAKRLCYVTADQVVAVAEAIVKVQRDFGNRADRKQARLKYLLHDRGLDWFKAKVEEYYGAPLPEPHPEDVWGFDDHLGWHEQGDGRWFYGLNVENGRLKDEGDFRIKTALRVICNRLQPSLRLTSHQSILFCDIAADDRGTLEDILREHGVKLSHEISTVRRWSMACVAWPTCGLSITEAERALPGIIDQFERELAKIGLHREAFTVRMTGCPNGCARPYNSDIGLVGKSAGKYTILVGGRLLGDRLNFIFRDSIPEADVVPTIMPLFHYFKHERSADETFGDFCHRKGAEDLVAWTDQFAIAGGTGETNGAANGKH
ncbi:MAG: NADPH-dependent assimilatory sulfite reductase hemoprotein subunit [Planctomycetaceae bacterium]|nr:NADPH-dependent assimilatory sulfite reductase hemoprotein subunit [Planctomycetaceae bacterium]